MNDLNAEFVQRAEAIMPGCCLASMYLPQGRRVVIESANGSRLRDVGGREYVDFSMGSGPLILGHAHPHVVEAVTKQAARGSTYFVMNRLAVELAERIIAAVPCGEALRFQTTGSDATFAAMRIARAATGRSKILQFEGGFYGGHDAGQLVAVAGDPPRYPDPAATCAGLPNGAVQDVLVAPFNDLAATEAIIESRSHDIAAILVEPLHRVFAPRNRFLEKLRELATKHGIVLIFDEVVSGFRLAWGGGQERYGVVPDLACYGKAIGGGYPVSAVVGRRDLIEFADPGRKGQEPWCFVGGTLTGNPVSCAAGLATLDELSKPGAYDKLNALGDELRRGLANAAQRSGQAVHLLGEGSILQVCFLDGPEPLDHRGLHRSDASKAMAFSLGLIDRGIFVNPGGKFYLSLAHSPADLQSAIEAADASFRALSATGINGECDA